MVVVGIFVVDFRGMSAGTGVVAGGSSGSEGTGAVAGGNRVVEVDRDNGGPEAGAAERIAGAAGKAGGTSRCIATPTGSMGCCCCVVGCPSTTEGPSP